MFLLALLMALLQPQTGSPQEHPPYWLQVQESVTVQEGLCVEVPCSVHYPWLNGSRSTPAHGYWYRRKAKEGTKEDDLVATNDLVKEIRGKTRLRFHLLGDPGANNCSLSISGGQKGHRAQYYFRLERGHIKYSYLDYKVTVTVTALTQTPDIHIPEPLESGRPGHLLCSLPGACKPHTTSWVGAALRGSGLDFNTSEIQLSPSPQDHGTQLTCQVNIPGVGVSTERTVQLSVSYAPQRVTISAHNVPGTGDTESLGNAPRLEVRQGQALRLLCSADSQPPAALSWVLEARVLSWSSPVGSRTLGLELPGAKAGDAGRYTCRAENRLGSLDRTLNLSVLYPPQDLRVTIWQADGTVLESLRNGSSVQVLEGQSLRLVCVSHSNPPASVSWVWATQTLSPGQPSDPGILELPVVGREHEGELTCAAQNPLGAQSISLSLSVHSPPQMPGPSCSWEAEGLHCSCSSRAWPAPSLHWRLGEDLLEGNGSNASFAVTSSSRGPWANSSLSLHGGFRSHLRLSCEARNDHGAQRATVLLLPDRGFSTGAFVSICVITLLLGLCLLAITVKMLWKKRTQEKTMRPKLSRGSTILDYINVFPRGRSLARNQAKPNIPSGAPSPDTLAPEAKKNQKDGPDPQRQAPISENYPEEIHYATLNYPRIRPWETKPPQDTHSDYAEVRFH